MKRPFLYDDDGDKVRGGDAVCFSYGIPPVYVSGRVVQRGRRFIVLTPGHNPPQSNLRSLRRAVGSWYKMTT